MANHIQAYFQTENEAEDVRILLQAYALEPIEVGTVGDEHPEGLRFIVPVASGIGNNGGGFNAAAAAAIATESDTTPVVGDLDNKEELDTNHLHYVLSTEVKNEDYDAVVALIHRNKGHVQELD
jgi:hypothetical protein